MQPQRRLPNKRPVTVRTPLARRPPRQTPVEPRLKTNPPCVSAARVPHVFHGREKKRVHRKAAGLSTLAGKSSPTQPTEMWRIEIESRSAARPQATALSAPAQHKLIYLLGRQQYPPLPFLDCKNHHTTKTERERKNRKNRRKKNSDFVRVFACAGTRRPISTPRIIDAHTPEVLTVERMRLQSFSMSGTSGLSMLPDTTQKSRSPVTGSVEAAACCRKQKSLAQATPAALKEPHEILMSSPSWQGICRRRCCACQC